MAEQTSGERFERFGSPPHTMEEWLRIFIEDTDAYRRRRLTPWGRAESRGRIGGLEAALDLIRLMRANNGFPATIPSRRGREALDG